ncbi:MAG: tyrosine--tRNA ligase, partial [Acidimicrobiia bacterium]
MSLDEQVDGLTWDAAEVVSPDELKAKLAKGRPLRVKLGIDPTASDIHLGFAVVLRKLRQFQDLGHVAVLILGDFTARVGDPTGRSATRPQPSTEDIESNLRTYRDQARLILSEERLELRCNSEWLGDMGIDDVLRLTARMTVARLLERDDFQRRMQAGAPV